MVEQVQQDEVMSKPDSHEHAMTAMIGCHQTTTALTPEEFLEGYLSLRGIAVADLDTIAKPFMRSREWVEKNPQYKIEG